MFRTVLSLNSLFRWVPFVLFLQGILFYVPHIIFKKAEGGKVSSTWELHQLHHLLCKTIEFIKFLLSKLVKHVSSCLSTCVFHYVISAHAFFTTFSCAFIFHPVFLIMHFFPCVSVHAYFTLCSWACIFYPALRACVLHNVISAHAYFTLFSCACLFTTRSWACFFLPRVSRKCTSPCNLCARIFYTFSCAWVLQHVTSWADTLYRVLHCACVLHHCFYACVLRYVVLRMCTSPRVSAHASFTKCCRVHRVFLRSVIAHMFPHRHRLNMEVDLQSLFGLHATWCAQLYSLAERVPATPLSPGVWIRIRGRYWSTKIDDISL